MQKPSDAIEIFLQPGEYFFGDASTRLRTILGSCVAVTMWHPKLQVGGMCHIMLPTSSKHGENELNIHAKYADHAIALFIADIQKLGVSLKDFKVKVFGGGDMFPHRGKGKDSKSIGQKNIEMVRSLLQESGFNIHAEHLGGDGHRYIIFELWSGFVWLRHQPLKDAA